MRENWIKGFGYATAAALLTATVANAQYASGFEAVNGSADGTVLTGQEGYFLPNGPASDTNFEAYTYTANSLRLPLNPTGGSQFIAGIGQAGGTNERAQRLSGLGTTGTWTYAFDIAATFTGTGASAQNIGSFSLNEGVPGTFSIINLARWVDPVTASAWNADFVWFNGAGAQLIEQVADPAFQNLSIDHWYRWSTTIDFDTDQVLEVAITDITAGTTTTFNPVDRFMRAGANPDHHRFFAGTGVPGNTLAFDNIDIVPTPGVLALFGLGGLVATRRRR